MSWTLLIWCAVVFVAGEWVRQQVIAPLPKQSVRNIPETPTSLAWLAGGARRVVDTWWTQLLAVGFMAIEGDAKNQKYRISLRADLSGLDEGCARAAQALAGRGPLTPSHILAASATAVKRSRQEVERAGWFEDAGEIATRSTWMRWWLASLILMSAGGWILLDWSGWLTVLVCIAGLARAMMTPRSPRLTPAGQERLMRARLEHQAQLRAPQRQDLGIALALGGAAVLMGTPWAVYASPGAARTDNSSSSCSGGCATAVGGWGSDGSSGCGGDGGSGCGGGGCGGGGCGG